MDINDVIKFLDNQGHPEMGQLVSAYSEIIEIAKKGLFGTSMEEALADLKYHEES